MRIKVGKPWKCSCCKRESKPSGWVAAHWDLLLTHTCYCGQVVRLQSGVLDVTAPGEKP